MTNTDSRFIYFVDRDNVLVELEAEAYSFTSGVSVFTIAHEYCDAFGFELFTIENEQWEPADWGTAYAALEDDGRFTPERRAILFDY